MVDPISIVSLSFQVTKILYKVFDSLKKAYRDGKIVHETLLDLQQDAYAVYELTSNIHQLCGVPAYIDAVRGVESEFGIDLEEGLERALERCYKGAQNLLDILIKFGLQTDASSVKKSYQAWRLDRRLNDIDKIKSKFLHYKSSIQLAFLSLTTCKQLQVAERDARYADDLKNQIAELQKVVEQISQQITSRKVALADEEQTQILDDMKLLCDTSRNLQRRATMQLEFITSRTSFTNIIAAEPPRLMDREWSHLPDTLEIDELGSSSSIDASPPPRQGNSVTSAGLSRGSISELSASPSSARMPISPSESYTTTFLSANMFEDKARALLSSAEARQMGKTKAFSDDVIDNLANLLSAVGKHNWSERPRTYLVLRLISEVTLMDNFVLEGFKDVHLPYKQSTLPNFVNGAGVRSNFLQHQNHVLNQESTNLVVKGASHQYLKHSVDNSFKVISKLGSGGFSVVDHVRSKLTLQEYARKRIDRGGIFTKNPQALKAFENEVHNLKRLKHPHLVELIGSYSDRKYIGIIMQPVADMDLHHYLARQDLAAEDLTVLQGDQILLADFGTALDWTELDNEVTFGQAEAFTKLYAAPETVLAGVPLKSKSKFFESRGTPSAAYWCNHDEINLWLDLIRKDATDINAALYRWIGAMTALDIGSRPTADDLYSCILEEQTSTIRYGRSCCFEDLCSDDTSPEDNGSDNGVFETARVPTISDITTMSSMGVPMPQLASIKPSLPTKSCETSDNQESVLRSNDSTTQPSICQSSSEQTPAYQLQVNYSSIPLELDELIRSWTLGESATPKAEVREPSISASTAPNDLGHNTGVDPMQDQVASIGPELPLLSSISSDDTDSLKAIVIKALRDAFLTNHQRFENDLLELKNNSTEWPSYVLELCTMLLVDQKGFNILLAACTFKNIVLSQYIVDITLRQRPDLINDVTIHKNSALHFAAFSRKTQIVQLLIQNGAQTGFQNILGYTPLHLAVRFRFFDVAQIIIPHLSSIDINKQDLIGLTPLLHACLSDSVDIVRQLIIQGAKCDLADRYGRLPIESTKDEETMKLLRADTDISQSTPKFKAILSDSNEIVKSMMDGLFKFWEDCLCLQRPIGNDYLPYTGSSEGPSRVHAPYTDPPILLSREEFADKPLPPYPGQYYYDYLIEKELAKTSDTHFQQDVVKTAQRWLERRVVGGLAACQSNPNKAMKLVGSYYSELTQVHAIVKILLDYGAAVDTSSVDWAPLGTTSRPTSALESMRRSIFSLANWPSLGNIRWLSVKKKTWSPLDRAVESQNVPLIKVLLDRNAKFKEQETAIPLCIFAIIHDRSLSARMLLRAGFDVNGQLAEDKTTALHHAVLKYEQIGWHIPLLLAHGASTDLRDCDGNTPLHLAIFHNHIHAAVALLESGANIGSGNNNHATPLSLAMDSGDHRMLFTLISYRVDDATIAYVIRVAIRKNLDHIVQELLEEYSTDTSFRRISGNVDTALHLLARSSITNLKVIDMLFGYGIDINARNIHGETALYAAASSGNILIAKKLLELGADKSTQQEKGRTPLDQARWKGHDKMITLLSDPSSPFNKNWWQR
ncbi:hypothetical protein N0V90_005382 [Kalmusia sp. IMI 367209]|nr:hypothetical protein N0V90_005382 [Kalmusia sp. IMI 367209]